MKAVVISEDELLHSASLTAVLQWAEWERAPKQAELLKYICEHVIAGRAQELKESTIAVEVFGRTPDFDQTKDSVVRVHMYRLRKKLEKFYAEDGAEHAVRISIPLGQYVPQFTTKTVAPPALAMVPAAIKSEGLRRNRLLLVGGAGFVALLVLTAGLWARWGTPKPPLRSEAAPVMLNREVRILCGNTGKPFVDRAGRLWTADRYFIGGGHQQAPPVAVAGLPEPGRLEFARTGDFEYRIPMKAGIYEMRLYFLDSAAWEDPAGRGQESQRVFRVDVNGEPVLTAYDPISDRGRLQFSVRTLRDVSPTPDGILSLRFRSQIGLALLSAIEVQPGEKGHLLPIRLLAGTATYRDSHGHLWMPDDFFTGGRLAAHPAPLAGTPDPTIYMTERFGNFEYAIPVPPGLYTARIHFAEHWWGQGAPGGPNERRIFDIFANGQALLRNFDIASAEGTLRPVVRSFSHLSPNAQGKLVFDFVPVRDYSSVHAIEILDEAQAPPS